MKKSILSAVFVCLATSISAQDLTLDANLKTRGEYRHGQGSLFEKEAKPAAFLNQRVRLNAFFEKDWLTLGLSGQQVFTWGDAPQPQGELSNHFGLFEAWAGARMDENWALKVGRQVISYDDERILGALDWSQYGRFHDAAVVFYAKDDLKADFGLAFNQNSVKAVGNAYEQGSKVSYKTMQFLHLNKRWNQNSLSFLFMNNGFQDMNGTQQDGVSNMQTTGLFGKFPISDVTLEGSFYYQSGKYQKVAVSAYQFRLEASYKIGKTLAALGFETLSGRDYDDTSTKQKSFVPLFGTNHKFNGFMDMYYVGSLQGQTGLNDFYAKLNVPCSEKSSLLFMPHIFTTSAKRADNKSYLGTELDFVYSHKFSSDVTLNVGYSHHFPSSILKNNTTHSVQNWAYVELYIKPTLFTTKK